MQKKPFVANQALNLDSETWEVYFYNMRIEIILSRISLKSSLFRLLSFSFMSLPGLCIEFIRRIVDPSYSRGSLMPIRC